MEHENDYNRYGSKGATNTSLGFGIAGTALGLMAGGLNGTGLFGGNARNICHEDHYVNRYEASQSARISELETEVKLRDSNIYTDSKILDLYKYVDGKFACVERELCDQKVFNATSTSTISCLSNQIATLMSLTKTVVPNSNICPGWGDVTVSVTPTTTAGA